MPKQKIIQKINSLSSASVCQVGRLPAVLAGGQETTFGYFRLLAFTVGPLCSWSHWVGQVRGKDVPGNCIGGDTVSQVSSGDTTLM